MKKLMFLMAAGLITFGSYAQTQRTSRTNSRPHNPTDTPAKTERNMPKNDRMTPPNDMDRNNPNNNTNNTNTNGTTPNGTNTNGTNTGTPAK